MQMDCRNCENALPEGAKFCPSCGQKNTTGRVSVWQLLKESLRTVFDIDSRFFRTLGAIFIPGKLTLEYFKGKHKKYAPPFRLFFILGIIHFTAMGFVLFNNFQEEFERFQDDERAAAFRTDILKEIDSFKEKVVENTIDDNLAARSTIDTLYAKIGSKYEDNYLTLGYFYLDSNWDLKAKNFEVRYDEVYSLAEDEILDKYNVVKSFIARAQIRQELRVVKDPGDFFKFAIGQLIWMVILMMFALGVVLKIIYIRRGQYYVEHLIFSFHYHAFAFLVVTIPLLLLIFQPEQYTPLIGPLIGVSLLIILFYLLFAMRRVYQQSWLKTILKFFLLNISYLFVFNLFLSLSFVASVFFY